MSNIGELGKGTKVFICFAPDPGDLYSGPGDSQATIEQQEFKIWFLIHNIEQHGFLVSSEFNMPESTVDIPTWMASEIDDSDFVVIIGSPALKELVSCPKPHREVKDERIKHLFIFSNSIHGVLQHETTAKTKVVTVILDDHYQDDVVPTIFAGGNVYHLHVGTSPYMFDYDHSGPFEDLICHMANITCSQSPREVQSPPTPYQGGE